MAISGATNGQIGVAGSLALNVSTTTTEALLFDVATVSAQDGTLDGDATAGAVALTAVGTSEAVVSGTASTKGNGSASARRSAST